MEYLKVRGKWGGHAEAQHRLRRDQVEIHNNHLSAIFILRHHLI